MAGGTRSSSKSDDENTEKLISRVCANFVNQMEAKFDAKLEKLSSKLNEVCDLFKDMKQQIQKNAVAIGQIEELMDGLDQQNKRNSMRLCGLLEKDGEDLLEIVPSFVVKKLKIPCSRNDINYIFRAGKENIEGKCRPIIINFVNGFKRNEVFNSKKLLKDSGVSIFEDLTRSRYELLSEAKKKWGVASVWSSNGKIYRWVAEDRKRILIKSKDDIPK